LSNDQHFRLIFFAPDHPVKLIKKGKRNTFTSNKKTGKMGNFLEYVFCYYFFGQTLSVKPKQRAEQNKQINRNNEHGQTHTSGGKWKMGNGKGGSR